MKSDYVVRARKFMVSFLPYLDKFDSVVLAVSAFNSEKHRKVQFYHGAVRYCLVTSDYAIKWDYDVHAAQTFGGCMQELINYQYACNSGYGYLFAEITEIVVMGRKFYVMPRIDKLAIEFDMYEPDSLLSYDEYEFIHVSMRLADLHDENWGMLKGKIKIIDYACIEEEYYNSEESGS